MSKAWSKGSTRAWRRVRSSVLARDGHRCRLQLPGCTGQAECVHHLVGRAVSGDDAAQLVSACSWCNGKAGDPTRVRKPKTRRRVRRW